MGNGEEKDRGRSLVKPHGDYGNGIQDMTMRTDEGRKG